MINLTDLFYSESFTYFATANVLVMMLLIVFGFSTISHKIKYFLFSISYFLISITSLYFILTHSEELLKNKVFENILLFAYSLIYTVASLSWMSILKMKEAIKKSEELAQRKTMFTAMISHELRTPLNGIIGASQLIKATHLNDEQKTYVNMMSDCGEALLVLINDVLDFSKLESNAFSFENKEFDPQALIFRILDMMAPQAVKKNLQLIPYVDKSKYLVKSDETRLFQVIMNILSNAIKFTDNGKVEITQKWSKTENGLLLNLEIADTGIGMSDETIKRLFNPYSQGDSSINRRFGGTGLGLVISKKLVDLMGGHIFVRSYPNLGSTFYIDIEYKDFKEINNQQVEPSISAFFVDHKLAEKSEVLKSNIKTSQNNQMQLITEQNSNERIQVKNSQLKILICDDVAVNLLVLKKTIEKLGFSCVAVDSGYKVIEQIKNNNFDLLFLDIQMPELDGLQTAKIIRSELNNNKIHIVALTANHSEEDKNNALAAGMNDFMSKPFKIESILSKIEDVINHNQVKVS